MDRRSFALALAAVPAAVATPAVVRLPKCLPEHVPFLRDVLPHYYAKKEAWDAWVMHAKPRGMGVAVGYDPPRIVSKVDSVVRSLGQIVLDSQEEMKRLAEIHGLADAWWWSIPDRAFVGMDRNAARRFIDSFRT